MLGTDGQKMSKSYNNFINIFLPEKELKDMINKKIITDTTPLEDPKDAENSVVYKLFKLIASTEASAELKSKLEAGGYGWGHAKKDLFETILTTYSKEREIFNHYMNNPGELEERLLAGASKARVTAQNTLSRVRKNLGY